MVSDADLVERLREFLRSSDLSTTTTATVRRRLEEDFAVDLSDKKAFIREQVDLFLNEIENKEEEAEEAEEEGGSGEEVEEEGEEEEEEEEGDGGKKSNGKSRKKRGSQKPKEAKKRGGGGGFTKLCSLSPQLEEFLGVSELARTQVVKKIWEYIRENSLQNPSNKRKIMCDDKLQSLFKVDTIDMFQMTKALSKHIWPLNSDGAAGPSKSTPKEKPPKREREDSEESSQKVKKPKGGNSGGSSALMVPLQLSDALAKFIGTGETALSRSDVVKRMWEYIKLNNLQDPADKRNIICDEKLKELFEVDSFTGFTVSKLLASHFIKS